VHIVLYNVMQADKEQHNATVQLERNKHKEPA